MSTMKIACLLNSSIYPHPESSNNLCLTIAIDHAMTQYIAWWILKKKQDFMEQMKVRLNNCLNDKPVANEDLTEV
jgi:hypothetical protein